MGSAGGRAGTVKTLDTDDGQEQWRPNALGVIDSWFYVARLSRLLFHEAPSRGLDEGPYRILTVCAMLLP